MKNDEEQEHFLKNEKIQVYLRITLVTLFITSAIYIYHRDGHLGNYSFSTILFLPLLVIFFNLVYFFVFLKHFPFLYQKSRIVVIILTQLPNRLLFEKTLQESMNAYVEEGKKFALFFIDLDGFKEINDIYGHETGDKVLIEVAQRISEMNSFTARLGGDEFICIVSYTNDEELQERAETLLQNVTKKCKDKRLKVSASIGVARYPDDAKSSYEIKKYSDTAMYKAKQEGKNKVCFYADL